MDDNIIKQVADQFLNAIEREIPNFQGFDDPRFIEKEISYKKIFISDAKEELSKENLQDFIQRKDYDSFYKTVLKIGRHKDNNLLYRGTPSTGDLALLNDESLDHKAFSNAFYELLHGDADSNDRLDAFCEWIDNHDLPNKWTFVTYYLYVINPDEELFVKPTEIKKFLDLLNKRELWHHRPTGKLYKTIKNDLWAIGDELPFEIKRGFLDLQSFLWTALASKDRKLMKVKGRKLTKAKDRKLTKAKKYLEIYSEEVDVHLSGQADFLEPRYSYFQAFFKKENLENAEWSDFQEMGKKIHALATNALAYKRAFGNPNHDIEHYRKVFLYLAYGEDNLSARINEVLDKESDYYLKYLAKSFYGELIGYVFPSKYVFYNRRDKEAIEFLELNISKKWGETFGDFFIRYNAKIKPLFEPYEDIVGQRTETTLPLELDQFFSWLYDNHITYEKESDDEVIVSEPISGEKQYWWINANPKYWNISDYEVGEENTYTSINEQGNKRQVYQNFLDVKKGDLIVGYQSSPVKKVKAIIEVTDELHTDSEGKEIFSFKVKQFTPNQPSWDELKSFPELVDCQIFKNNQGSLFSLTEEEFQIIYDMAFQEGEIFESYTFEDAFQEVFLEEEELKNILNLLSYKKNIILQGPPGTGKTFLAKRLAWLMFEAKDPNRIGMIQFHPTYSYEDFIRGYRPTDQHFELKDGIFMQMCKKAKSDPNNPYFLIIDEINRGNLSKIFGELMMLIEKDKRGKTFTVSLPYKKSIDEPDFFIPKNLYLIGTMNTADRSLAMVDYALRRRFVFINMMPEFGNKFQSHLKDQGVDDRLINIIVERLLELNKNISDETGLGPDFQIGHSYFCHTQNGNEAWFKSVVKYEIIPLLNEYWFDKPTRVKEIQEKLTSL